MLPLPMGIGGAEHFLPAPEQYELIRFRFKILILNFSPGRGVFDALGGGFLQRTMGAFFLGALNRLHRTKAFPLRGRCHT